MAITRVYSHSKAPDRVNGNSGPHTTDRWPNINQRSGTTNRYMRFTAAQGYPVHPGRTHSGRYACYPGDFIGPSGTATSPGSQSGERVESAETHGQTPLHAVQGQDHYYAFSLWLPSGSDTARHGAAWIDNDSGYRLIMQWKSCVPPSGGGSPDLELSFYPSSGNNSVGAPGGLYLGCIGGGKKLIIGNPMPKGVWLDLIIYAYFHSGSAGQARAWYRKPGGSWPAEGSPTASHLNKRNMSGSNHFIWHRAGVYRGNHVNGLPSSSTDGGNPNAPTILYMDDVIRADTFAEAKTVLGSGSGEPPPTPEPEPTPAPTYTFPTPNFGAPRRGAVPRGMTAGKTRVSPFIYPSSEPQMAATKIVGVIAGGEGGEGEPALSPQTIAPCLYDFSGSLPTTRRAAGPSLVVNEASAEALRTWDLPTPYFTVQPGARYGIGLGSDVAEGTALYFADVKTGALYVCDGINPATWGATGQVLDNYEMTLAVVVAQVVAPPPPTGEPAALSGRVLGRRVLSGDLTVVGGELVPVSRVVARMRPITRVVYEQQWFEQVAGADARRVYEIPGTALFSANPPS